MDLYTHWLLLFGINRKFAILGVNLNLYYICYSIYFVADVQDENFEYQEIE